MSQRMIYQHMFSKGKVVNIGCGEDPCGFGDDAVHVDMDVYNHKNFVQADAHHLPFKDQEFDTAILGDMLEHCSDPAQVLREAARVAKKIVVTIFEEWRLPGEGLHTEVMVERGEKDVKDLGFDSHLNYLKSLATVKDKIVSVTDDSVTAHHFHIFQFTDENLRQIIDDAGLEVEILHKFPEGVEQGRQWYNWLLIGKRRAA